MTKIKIPWNCNFCGGKLLFFRQLEFSPELRKQLSEQAQIKGDEVFKVQKCDNKKCNRTYIFIEPRISTQQQSKEGTN